MRLLNCERLKDRLAKGMRDTMKGHIYLIGFMGTGKSTVSKALKKKLGWKEIDVDAMIVREQKMPISDIFAAHGEEHFRDIETEAMERIGTMEASIVSCGGGAVLRSQNVENMKKSGTIVLLTATARTVYQRVKGSKDRPILNGHMNAEYIEQLMEKRRDVYERACDLSVSTDGKTPDQIAGEIIDRI